MQKLDLKDIWKTTLARLEIKIDSPAHFKTWFEPTELLSIQGKQATIGVRNSYTSDWLSKKHTITIAQTLAQVIKAKHDIEIVFEISKNLANTTVNYTPKKRKESQSSLLSVQDGVNMDFQEIVENSNINYKFTFNDFIVGPSNRLAHAASLAIVEQPGTLYNPLFIYGSTGLGKTHLSHAVAVKLLEKNQGKKINYIPSETFLNEMVVAIQTGKTREFRNKYRYLDLLIIDDIQLISKWEQTQDELFNTFNALHNKQKQIILISDRPPEKIHNLESRLLSRFQGGMVVQVEKPDFETRFAILEQKIRQFGISLPKHIVEYMAEHVTDNIRKLEGSIQKIALFNNMHASGLSIEEVAKLLGTDSQSKREKIKPKDIVKVVAKDFGLMSKDILGKSRKSDIAFARQIIMYLLREDLGYKLDEIAHILNRKDHTTVIHAIDKIKSKIALDEGFEQQIQNFRLALTDVPN